MNRPLTDRERAVLYLLLEVENLPAREALRQQADAASVTGYCGCGCPSIHLGIDRHASEPATRRRSLLGGREPITGRPLTEARWEAGGGGVLLWCEGGWLDYLEVFWTTDDIPSELPSPEQLEPLPYDAENS